MAVTEVLMPLMGADMTEGAIARWLKREGDDVSRGDILAEVETDKAVVEMEAFGSGILRKVLIAEGVIVPVGRVIAIIADADEEIPDIGSSAEEASAADTPAPAVTPEPAAAASPAPAGGGRIKASPVARKIAAEHGIDLAGLVGSGPGGRIVKTDVEAAIAAGGPPAVAQPAAAADAAASPAPVALSAEDIPLSTMRKAIARTVVRSKTDQPDFWVSAAVDMTQAMNARSQLNETFASEGVKVSINDMILKAVALAIEKYPKWNASFADDRLIAHPDINIGVAIALEQGLMVPAVLKCQAKPLKQIAIESKDLANRAKSGGLTQEELTGGTFSVSNLGMYGIDEFAAIIMPPQAGILAVGSVTQTPVVSNDDITIASIMKITLTVDHRVNDGAEAAQFLSQIKLHLENPLSLVL
ncbi:MAG: 2-oxo acid dehydrogenase subunit E2 [Chloroflexi bacterium]|nr:2-oxo acid dehydrogenase subunit E2 [Chloroflexota bacterium]